MAFKVVVLDDESARYELLAPLVKGNQWEIIPMPQQGETLTDALHRLLGDPDQILSLLCSPDVIVILDYYMKTLNEAKYRATVQCLLSEVKRVPNFDVCECVNLVKKLPESGYDLWGLAAIVLALCAYKNTPVCISTAFGIPPELAQFKDSATKNWGGRITTMQIKSGNDAQDVINWIRYVQREIIALDTFWQQTAQLSHSDIGSGKADNPLRKFILRANDGWPGAISGQCVHECLKTMCGRTSAFESGDQPLSVMGAMFIALGAIASRTRSPLSDSKISISNPNEVARRLRLFRFQSKPLARDTTRALFAVLSELSWDEDNNKPNEVDVTLSGSELTLNYDINPFQSQRPGRLPLAASLTAQANHILFKKPMPGEPPGISAKAITDFWIKSLKTDNSGNANWCFPMNSCLRLCARRNEKDSTFKLVLKLVGRGPDEI